MSDLAKSMDVKEAIRFAKAYVRDVFADESLTNLGLEEVDFDPDTRIWLVTLGFSRPWDSQQSLMDALANPVPRRSYKTVAIDESGKVLSVKDRPI